MNMDKMLYLVICKSNGEEYAAERKLHYMDSGSTLKSLVAGEWTNVERILVFNPVEHICSDVSEEFARAAQNLWADNDEPLSEWQQAFIADHRVMEAA